MDTFLIVRRGVLPAIALTLCAGTVLAVLAARRTTPSGSSAPGSPEVPRIRAEGRVVARPGAEVVLGTERGGRIASLPVREGDRVRRGDLVAEIDAAELRAALDEARARVAEAKAEVRFLEAELARAEELLSSRAGSSQARDLAERNLDVARAREDSARASVARIEAEIAKTRVLSPIDGVVVARFADPGETVQPLERVATVADLSQVRVEAEVDEFDAARVRLGAEGVVTAEGHDGVSWTGTVEEVPDIVVPRALRPEDPARPSDARVLHVKVSLPPSTPLKLGQRVEVEIR
ncbi:MAG: efflux RND transporter periplasmic adaptor subunit [Planctomycetota bacterium]